MFHRRIHTGLKGQFLFFIIIFLFIIINAAMNQSVLYKALYTVNKGNLAWLGLTFG